MYDIDLHDETLLRILENFHLEFDLVFLFIDCSAHYDDSQIVDQT
jgi:hypothetical protein